ncbi:MAG TPA: N-acyl homoserine lactonase family protein [Candidatus Merdiplasma excrementigallinarum]|uniref:N-acyl homoserine lactonase family protein n=1 Tax=Candidatus Merdiplasma excrementigallinarum TaxID=2840864 RepID=A0A9D1NZQ5_9FIRM|nr:N-acyl homoserine lactonase family protein [Candidatus Merdiplasma excrementigallinarum]
MKLYVLDLGKIIMRGENPVISADHDGGEEPAIPIHAFLLDTPAGKILFDTGCHPQAMEGAWPAQMCTNPYVPGEGGKLLERLEQIGVKPEDISIVVASHLHLDHAGGIYLFPKAKVYVQQQELDRVLHDAATGTLEVFCVPCDVENWEKTGVKWEQVPSDVREIQLCPGVSILNFGPGHSYGMLGMYVELENERFLLASDAVYSREYYGPPAKLSGAVYDKEGYFSAIEYIREYAQRRQAEVLFGHDMEQFKGLKKSDRGFYE